MNAGRSPARGRVPTLNRRDISSFPIALTVPGFISWGVNFLTPQNRFIALQIKSANREGSCSVVDVWFPARFIYCLIVVDVFVRLHTSGIPLPNSRSHDEMAVNSRKE